MAGENETWTTEGSELDPGLVITHLGAKRGRKNNEPHPPGYSPRWKKQHGRWVDPKTGAQWHYHAEDGTHYSHWDVHIPGKKKIRKPIDSSKGVFKE